MLISSNSASLVTRYVLVSIPRSWQEPFDNIPEDVICAALVQILDRRNHPILIHCNKGKVGDSSGVALTIASDRLSYRLHPSPTVMVTDLDL